MKTKEQEKGKYLHYTVLYFGLVLIIQVALVELLVDRPEGGSAGIRGPVFAFIMIIMLNAGFRSLGRYLKEVLKED